MTEHKLREIFQLPSGEMYGYVHRPGPSGSNHNEFVGFLYKYYNSEKGKTVFVGVTRNGEMLTAVEREYINFCDFAGNRLAPPKYPLQNSLRSGENGGFQEPERSVL